MFNSQSKYKCGQAWKWFIVLFEQSFVFQILITIFFWVILWPEYRDLDKFKESPMLKYEIMIDHIVPPVCLIVEFMFNIIPFSKRHSLVTFAVGFGYCFLDFLTVKLITKEPIYPYIAYDDAISFIIPLICVIANVLFFFIVYWISQCKFRCYARRRGLEK